MPSYNQVAKKRGRPRKNLDLDLVLEMVSAGMTDQEIADVLGVSARTFRAYRKQHGIAAAAGHGGARQGAGRKKTISPVVVSKKRPPWRGKANWPAGVAATRRTISPRDAALWCGQEYDFMSPGLYRFNENRAGLRPRDMPKFLRTDV